MNKELKALATQLRENGIDVYSKVIWNNTMLLIPCIYEPNAISVLEDIQYAMPNGYEGQVLPKIHGLSYICISKIDQDYERLQLKKSVDK